MCEKRRLTCIGVAALQVIAIVPESRLKDEPRESATVARRCPSPIIYPIIPDSEHAVDGRAVLTQDAGGGAEHQSRCRTKDAVLTPSGDTIPGCNSAGSPHGFGPLQFWSSPNGSLAHRAAVCDGGVLTRVGAYVPHPF